MKYAKKVIAELNEAMPPDLEKVVNWKYQGTVEDIEPGIVLKSIKINKGSSMKKLTCSIGNYFGTDSPRDSLANSFKGINGSSELWDIKILTKDTIRKTFVFALVKPVVQPWVK